MLSLKCTGLPILIHSVGLWNVIWIAPGGIKTKRWGQGQNAFPQRVRECCVFTLIENKRLLTCS